MPELPPDIGANLVKEPPSEYILISCSSIINGGCVLYRYILRAVYVMKGSKLLPPTFASIFDDSALSSLDIFFDPSNGSISLPGVTMGKIDFFL